MKKLNEEDALIVLESIHGLTRTEQEALEVILDSYKDYLEKYGPQDINSSINKEIHNEIKSTSNNNSRINFSSCTQQGCPFRRK